MKIKILPIIVAVLLLSSVLSAQTIFKISNSGSAKMKLSGTSTFHDWVMNATNFKAEAEFIMTDNGTELKSLSALTFSIPVENLKSDKKSMDETAYKALKSNQYKEIIYKLTSATIKSVLNNKYEIVAIGNLSIAGVTKVIAMNVSCQMNADKSILCTGTQKLKMTDYQVKPPCFLGFMKTGDDIAINFVLPFKANDNLIKITENK